MQDDHDNNLDAYLDLLKQVLIGSTYDDVPWSMVDLYGATFAGRRFPRLRRFFLRRWIDWLRRQGVVMVKPGHVTTRQREEGRDWPFFGYTMVGAKRLDNLRDCVEDVLRRGVRGDILEAGVWRGGASLYVRAILRAHQIEDRKVWLADSFEGMPKPKFEGDGGDHSHIDALKVSLEEVKANFQRFDLLDDQVAFLKGWFCDTLAGAPIERLAVLRLDADMYSSTMDTLVNLYDKVSEGGYVIVDDYHSWPECKRAVTDFLQKRGFKPRMEQIDYTAVCWKKD